MGKNYLAGHLKKNIVGRGPFTQLLLGKTIRFINLEKLQKVKRR